MKRISPLTIVDRALAVVCVLLALSACGAGEAGVEGLMADMLAGSETESGRDVTFGPLALRLPARWKLDSAGESARVDSEIGELVFKATGRDEPVVSEPVELPGEAVHRLRLELAAQCSRPNQVYVDDMTAARPLRLLVGVCENDDVANPRDATYWVRYVVLADAGRLTVDMKGQGSLVEARTRMDPILVNARVR
jgi:hypothetical protein